MNIAVLGYGVDGRATADYFKKHGHTVTIFDHFQPADLLNYKLNHFDFVFRSPSVPPYFVIHSVDSKTPTNWTSATHYFFEHCPAPIIGVTGTKGKGTTASITTTLMQAAGHKVHLLGNIGIPALSKLDQIKATDLVIYELSSFQLWDLPLSPHVAVVLRIEPDHLDVHCDYQDYLTAKTNIVKHQTADDYCIYYQPNADSSRIAAASSGTKLSYPLPQPSARLTKLLDLLPVPGEHNRENAEAALFAVAAFHQATNLEEFIAQPQHFAFLSQGLQKFTGLPHRLEFVRELNQVKYYDDNFSSAFPATDVAIAAFEDHPTVLIAGGKDRHLDLSAMQKRLFSAKNLQKIILIGEIKEQLAANQDPTKYQLADNLPQALQLARLNAEPLATVQHPAIVLMSPGAASFDMFKNFQDRGEQFQKLVRSLS
ncbi:MAG: UDP-N-acetylmuramoyl-L-alanine--D-glutamate ligase [Candidatus Saccharibacteria bacterium]|nr:UDP-N-acetylmuramoyl-L-alanine--D-glutamate ligase [Candidatus Saccharibacteria bacterium]